MSLAARSLTDFSADLASASPAPGGGSASAAAGAAGAALLAMVVRLTLGKEKYKNVEAELAPLADELDVLRARLLELVDLDTQAYDAIVAARRLPKETGGEKAAREKALADATLVATTVPLQTATYARDALGIGETVAEKGNTNAASDAWVAALLLAGAVEGALANVRINLGAGMDAELLRGFREDSEDLEKAAAELLVKARVLARARGLATL